LYRPFDPPRPDIISTRRARPRFFHFFGRSNSLKWNNSYGHIKVIFCRKFVRPDCVSDPTVCHGNASCDHHTRQCSCNLGHIGDGFVCNPDPQDCVLRKDLCSPEALCIGRRCRCVEGFTGDGIKCVSLYQRSVNCSECDANAHCNDGMCQCNVGYFGNGLCCVPDPRDCVHFSGVCHPDATCDRDERVCKCNTGFLGDGISCFPVRSCRSDPNVCDVEAICLPSGQCICKHGFRGNGYNCIKISPLLRHQSNEPLNSCMNSCDRETELCISGSCVCKHGYEQRKDGKCVDVNECLSSPCHHLATCTNLHGSFACTCPDGYAGDGKTCIQHLKIGELGVFCEPDGMTLVLGNETTAFEGRIFVRGQAENPYCAKTFSSLQHAAKPYMFKVPFEHCNVRLEDQDTFATTVIVQKHPMFITTAADAYDLRCTYPVGVREVESNVNVSDLTTSSTLTDNAHGPSCRLTVTNEADESIAAAVVGQALRLRLEVMPNETYSILPRNCFAINIETGDRYSLTDKAGCAIDDQLFPEWTKIRPSLTEAVFRTFKWPDSSMIRFQCDCSACVGNCPEMNCGRRREAAMRRFRFRRVRDIKNGSAIEDRPTDLDYDEDEEEKELLKKIIDPKRLAFSSLVRVREDEEEERAQQQVDHWRNGVTMESETIKELVTQEAAVCLRTVLVFGAMAVTCFCVVVLIYISIRRRRCKAITMQASMSTIGL
uniref:ZP domain-containing protein n=1 Tax=Haemonchus placei TaxID=6290 RepID=A0A0N4WVW7_HAEPC